jgi:hypothetical protein
MFRITDEDHRYGTAQQLRDLLFSEDEIANRRVSPVELGIPDVVRSVLARVSPISYAQYCNIALFVRAG